MGSELSASGLGWLASALGGFSLGAAAACALRAILSRRKGCFRKSRSFVSLLFVSLSMVVAAGAALLVFPPKALLWETLFWIWAGAWAPVGFLSTLFPRWVGIPLVIVALTALGLGACESAGWHTLVPGREAARFMPYDVTESGARGDLSVPNRNAVPVLSKIILEAGECALEAREMRLSGPIAAFFGERKYILTRITDGQGVELLRFPEKKGPLRRFLAAGELRIIWIIVRTAKSGVQPLSEYRAISWTFDVDGNLEAAAP